VFFLAYTKYVAYNCVEIKHGAKPPKNKVLFISPPIPQQSGETGKQKANGARLGLRAPSRIKAWKQAECDSLPPFTFVPLII
jgi:hypothetical protein